MIVKDAPLQLGQVDPYSFASLSANRYSVQNMLIARAGDFPSVSCPVGSEIHDAYEDRLCMWDHEKYNDLCEKHGAKFLGDWARGVDSAKLLAFVRDALDMPHATGCRIVRFTNVSSGYPCHRIDAYANPSTVEASKKEPANV